MSISRAGDVPLSRSVAVKRRGSCPAATELSGSRRGMTSQMNGSATTAAISTIGVKWNTLIGGRPMSLAIDTTSRLVDVPIVVAMPPISTALLTGISVLDAGIPPLAAIAAMTGQHQHEHRRVVDHHAHAHRQQQGDEQPELVG